MENTNSTSLVAAAGQCQECKNHDDCKCTRFGRPIACDCKKVKDLSIRDQNFKLLDKICLKSGRSVEFQLFEDCRFILSEENSEANLRNKHRADDEEILEADEPALGFGN